MLTRRNFLALGALALPGSPRSRPAAFAGLPAALAQLERTSGGRVGVSVLDTATGERSGRRAHERFPMCSTFKFLLASAVLRRADRREETLERAVAVPRAPLLPNSPLTEPHAGGEMSVGELCHAALTRSDNTAANLLLESIGGPTALTQFARSIGDPVTRLDRTEIALNEARAGDPRDSTSPAAMAGDLQSVLLGEVLSQSSRSRLTLWMEASVTGLEWLRAKMPEGWRAADKTGANGADTTNDIAVLWPAGGVPAIVAAYITGCAGPESKRAAMLAEIGRLVRESIAPLPGRRSPAAAALL
jgi:beta-lactamase class A